MMGIAKTVKRLIGTARAVKPVKVSVLGYMEYGEWVAHALEMDVIGVGETWEDACAELKGNIVAHVSFAKYLGDESLILQPAPPYMFKRFREAQKAELQSLFSQAPQDSSGDFRSESVSIPRNIPAGAYVAA